jgi:hypothetical protein
MLVESCDEYAMRVHDHIIRVLIVVTVNHVLIEAVELPQDLGVHIYRLISLDTHVSSFHQHHLLKLTVFEKILWYDIVVNLDIYKGDLV